MDCFEVGDEVSWPSYVGKSYGYVVAISGDRVTVEYGPWSDRFWCYARALTKESRRQQEGR